MSACVPGKQVVTQPIIQQPLDAVVIVDELVEDEDEEMDEEEEEEDDEDLRKLLLEMGKEPLEKGAIGAAGDNGNDGDGESEDGEITDDDDDGNDGDGKPMNGDGQAAWLITGDSLFLDMEKSNKKQQYLIANVDVVAHPGFKIEEVTSFLVEQAKLPVTGIIVSAGANDLKQGHQLSTIMRHLERMITEVRKQFGGELCLLPLPPWEGRVEDAWQINQKLYELAEKYGKVKILGTGAHSTWLKSHRIKYGKHNQQYKDSLHYREQHLITQLKAFNHELFARAGSRR